MSRKGEREGNSRQWDEPTEVSEVQELKPILFGGTGGQIISHDGNIGCFVG